MTAALFAFLPQWLLEFRSIAVALLNDEGRIVEANQGFLLSMQDITEGYTSANFIEPDFISLKQATSGPDGQVYDGLITLGSANGIKRSFSGKVYRINQMLFIAAELDIAAFENLSTEVERLTQEVDDANRLLTRRNQALQKIQEEMDELKRRDNLTGLSNRAQLDMRMEEEIQRWERYRRPLGLVLMDMDGFAGINESYGREAGDEVIKHVATILMQTLRSLDLAARYGGQEFAILLPETNEMGALIVAERLRMELEGQLILPLLKPLTASFGVAMLLSDEKRDELYARAWRALKHSKQSGRNCVTMAGVVSECDHIYHGGREES